MVMVTSWVAVTTVGAGWSVAWPLVAWPQQSMAPSAARMPQVWRPPVATAV